MDPRHEILRCLDDLRAACAKWRCIKTRSAEKAVEEAWQEMQQHIITLSPSMREARENLNFFNLFFDSTDRKMETMSALVAKLAGTGKEFIGNLGPNVAAQRRIQTETATHTAQCECPNAETTGEHIEPRREDFKLTAATRPNGQASERARQMDPPIVVAPPDDNEAKRGKARSNWLDQKMHDKGWTAGTALKGNGGPSYNTIRRYRSGKKSNQDRSVRSQLSKALRCSIEEVPE